MGNNILNIPGMDVIYVFLGFLIGSTTTLMGNEIKDIQSKEPKIVYFVLIILFLGLLFYIETKELW